LRPRPRRPSDPQVLRHLDGGIAGDRPVQAPRAAGAAVEPRPVALLPRPDRPPRPPRPHPEPPREPPGARDRGHPPQSRAGARPGRSPAWASSLSCTCCRTGARASSGVSGARSVDPPISPLPDRPSREKEGSMRRRRGVLTLVLTAALGLLAGPATAADPGVT